MTAATQANAAQLAQLFNPKQGYFRDMLTLSWDYRTLDGQEAIRSYLENGEALKKSGLKNLRMEGEALFVEAMPGLGLERKTEQS